MLISKKYIFLLVNFFMMAGVMFSVTDFFLGGLGVKFKYVFILYCLVDIISRKERPCSWNLALIFSLLTLYVLVWGFIFRNPIVAVQIAGHTKTMLIYLAMLIPCAIEVIHYKCIEEYTVLSGAALLLVLVVQTLSHRNEIIFNPVFAVRSFMSHSMVRSAFGYLDTNFVGNTCFLVGCIIFMVYTSHLRNPLFHSRIRIVMLLAGFFIFWIMLCTSSRTPMICMSAFVGVTAVKRLSAYVHFSRESVKALRKYAAVGVPLLLLLLYATDFWGGFWESSNRGLNVSVNLPWVPILGNIWTGMGFVENGAFITDASNNWISAFGVATSSLDMNYLYIYCTTGILGCGVMASILFLLGFSLYKNRGQKYGFYYLLMFALILFYAFMETILFTYRFWAMMVPYVILFYGADRGCKECR